jgi:hypothetical protein
MWRPTSREKGKMSKSKTISGELLLPNELPSWEVSLLAPILAGIVGKPNEGASDRRQQEAGHERQRRA